MLTVVPQARNIAVLGGGILGLAVARELSRSGRAGRVLLFEKETCPAAHQTGRNSGVVHSGLYYSPGSLKARMSRRGRELLRAYCEERSLPFELSGKVVVATTESERARLVGLAERGRANGVALEVIGPERLTEIEPAARGLAALHVTDTGITDYSAISVALAQDLEAAGASLQFGATVARLVRTDGGLRIEFDGGRDPVLVASAVNCTGLFADRIARASDAKPRARVVPFRGEYYALKPAASSLCRHLIYPVPDERFPFLGVHFTRRVGGGVDCGPNAVFALAREGYRWRDWNARDLWDSLTWPGTWRLFGRHWSTGCREAWRSASKTAFVRALQQLVPAVQREDLERAPAGVRAQALDRRGKLVDDFLVERDGPITHVISAPSPAATAALAIAEHIVAVH